MKIGIHVNQLDHRGHGTVTYDYSLALRDILGHEPIIISSKEKSTHPMDKFGEFKCRLYENQTDLPQIVDQEHIDLMYMVKAGEDDNLTPSNCKTGIHCVFNMKHPHGDVYAGVSEWLAKHSGRDLWVPHIVNLPKTTQTLHDELGVPKNAFVIGRLGGYEQFDVPDAREAVIEALNKRSDLWAIFLNTKPFVDHPRAKFIPFQPELSYKSKFINTCDAMIHGRSDGETFGLAVAEFSSFNKPVFTYDAPYWWYMRAHIDMLGEKALTYKNKEELLSYLLQIDKGYVNDTEWDCYSVRFSPKNVINKFEEVYIK
jgi:hypothetical protein